MRRATFYVPATACSSYQLPAASHSLDATVTTVVATDTVFTGAVATPAASAMLSASRHNGRGPREELERIRKEKEAKEAATRREAVTKQAAPVAAAAAAAYALFTQQAPSRLSPRGWRCAASVVARVFCWSRGAALKNLRSQLPNPQGERDQN